VFTSLPDERAVEAVVAGTAASPGLLAGARPGDVIVDLSTVSPRARAAWRRARPSGACA